MKKFLIKILIFALFFAAFDYGYGFVCNYLRKNAHGGQTYCDNFIADSLNADILLFGSSRVHQQYDPQIIMDSLNMSCYNCGRSGMGIIYHYGRWKVLSQRYCPKYIVYDILPVLDMMKRDDNIIFVNPLRNWYGTVSGIDSIFYNIDKTERYKMISHTYRNHSELMGLISDFKSHYYHKNGFEIVDKHMPINTPQISEKTDYEVDSLKLYYFEKFVKETKEKTKLIFVASPRWKYKKTGNAFDLIEDICRENDIPFLNHYCDSNFVDNPTYYSNEAHMNIDGATVWTKYLIKELRTYIKT